MGRYLKLKINEKFGGEKSLNAINRDLFENYGCPVESLITTTANLQEYVDYLNDNPEGKLEFSHLQRPLTIKILEEHFVWFEVGFVQVKLSGGMNPTAVKISLALAFWATKNKKKIDLEESADYQFETVYQYAQDSLPRFNESIKSGEFIITNSKRQDLAKEAFWGNNEDLADKIKDLMSYEMDGKVYPANGFTLAEAIKMVDEMQASELLFFVERPNFVIAQGETELLCGDECSIGVLFNNLTGSNLVSKGYEEFNKYLSWIKKELRFSALMPQKLSILVK